MSTKLMEIPVAEIEPMEGLNPRDKVGDVAELAASIKKHGVLQPVLVVEPNGNGKGKYQLIAGARRHAAAKKAKLKTLPAMVADNLGGAELEAAITENVQRENLSPLEEAVALKRLQTERGMTQKQAAEALGKSERWARERLRLLKLPARVQQGFDKRTVPIEAAVQIERVAKVAPATAEALVEQAEAGTIEAGQLTRSDGIGDAIEQLRIQGGKDVELGALVEVQQDHYHPGYKPKDLPLPDGEREAIEKAYREIPGVAWYTGGPKEKAGISFDKDDIAEARKAKALLEVDSGNGYRPKRYYLTDPEFIAKRVKIKLPKMLAAAKRKLKEREKDEERFAQARSDREKEQLKRKAAEERRREQAAKVNAELAERLRGFELKEPSVDVVKLVCSIALGHEDQLEDLISGGLGEIDEAYKTDHDAEDYAADKVFAELAKARTPEAAIAVVLKVAIPAYFAGTPEHRRWHGIPGPDQSAELHIDGQLERVATDLGVLPKPMAEWGRQQGVKRASERAEQEKREAEERVRQDLAVLSVLSPDGLDRAEIKQALRDDNVFLTGPDIGKTIARLSEAKQIEVEEQDDGEAVAITTTAVGRARLAEEKGATK